MGTNLLMVCLSAGLSMPCHGQTHAACTGPAPLAAKMHARPSVENAVALGGWFATHKRFDCAAETFRVSLKANPESAQLHYLVGLALIGGGHPAEALPELQQSEQLDPDVLKPHLMLGHLYNQSGEISKAQQEWTAALKIDPHAEMALGGLSDDLLSINLAKALGVLNHLDEAKAVLAEGLKLAPDSVPLASAMTVVLVKQTHYQEAVNLLQHTVAANPSNQDAELELFRLLVLTSRINQARPMGPKLLAERPHDPEVLYLNGVVERTLGHSEQAKTYLEEAVALDPNFFNSRYNLGKVLVILQQWPEAKEQLEKAIALGSIEPQVHYELAMALRGLGDTQGSAAEIKIYQAGRKVEEDSLEASMNSSQGDQDLASGDVAQAISHYTQATEGEPTNAGYQYQLATALHRSGDTVKEQAALEQAIKLNPALAGAQRALGYLLSRSGDTAGAIEHFRMAVKAEPAWTEAWINLSAELAEAGQFPEAREAVATALRLDPSNVQAKELSDQLSRDPSA